MRSSRPAPLRERLPFPLVMGLLVALVGLLLLVQGFLGSRNESGNAPPRSQSPATTKGPPPPCRYADLPAANAAYGDWDRTLVDPLFRLPQGYEPPDLVAIERSDFAVGRDLLVRSALLSDLTDLRKEAARSGHPIDVIAAYRSYQDQAALFAKRVREFGRTVALQRAARPGHSEHQLGTTVDFITFGDSDVTEDWASTSTGRWVAANAARFGFVLSYPRGEEDVTCYAWEPWHFRYFGRELAARIEASGLTVREYLWMVAK